MPRAEPARSLAPLPLSAVVGAATLRGRQSPHPVRLAARRRKAADSPLKGVLGTGRVSWGQPPSGYPWESPGADLMLRHAHCHDTLHARPAGEDWRGGRRLPRRP